MATNNGTMGGNIA